MLQSFKGGFDRPTMPTMMECRQRSCCRSFRILFTASLLFCSAAACENEPKEATGANPANVALPQHIVNLTAQEIQHAGIQVAPVTKGAFRTHRDFPATVQPNANRLADITTLVRGRAIDIHVDLGQDVEAGDLLATLQSSELGLAQSAYLKAYAKLSVAKRAFDRAKSLLSEKVIGEAEFQRREGEWISAEAEVREAYDRLRLLGMNDAEMQSLARDKKIRSTVRIQAPFAGRVIARNLTRGEIVEPGEKLFGVADLGEVWVVASVPEKDVRHIAKEQPAQVRLPAYPGEIFDGRITYVGDVLDPGTRTMGVRVAVPNPDKRLKTEMFATVRVLGGSEPDVLTVPVGSVQQDAGGPVVFVQTDSGVFERRSVKLSEEIDGVFRVQDGLSPGELIVTNGAFELKSELAGRSQGGSFR